jgi:hypothetical protein
LKAELRSGWDTAGLELLPDLRAIRVGTCHFEGAVVQ